MTKLTDPGWEICFSGIYQGPTELLYSGSWTPHDFRFSRNYTISGRKSTQKSFRPIFEQKGLTDPHHNA